MKRRYAHNMDRAIRKFYVKQPQCWMNNFPSFWWKSGLKIEETRVLDWEDKWLSLMKGIHFKLVAP